MIFCLCFTVVEELHAELCFAEALLLRALLTFIEDETLVSFIRAGIKIRSCYNSYKLVFQELEKKTRIITIVFDLKKFFLFFLRECNVILNSRTWFEDEKPYKEHFESGVRLGIGAFNLVSRYFTEHCIRCFINQFLTANLSFTKFNHYNNVDFLSLIR